MKANTRKSLLQKINSNGIYVMLFFSIVLFFVTMKRQSASKIKRYDLLPYERLEADDAPLDNPFIIVGSKTDPPFLVTVYTEHSDAYISSKILRTGLYGDLSLLMQQILKNGAKKFDPKKEMFLDLGANLAFHSLQAASMGYKVAMFEPNPRNINRIKTSILLNNFQDLMTIYPYAVSNKRGTETLSITQNSPGMATLGDKNKLDLGDNSTLKIGGKNFEFEVQVVKVDDYIQRDVYFLKIDVEGFEYYALQGAKKLLSEHKVSFILIEIFPAMLKAAGTDTIKLLDFICDLDYIPYIAHNNDELVELSRKEFKSYIEEVSEDGHGDLIFTHPDADMSLLPLKRRH